MLYRIAISAIISIVLVNSLAADEPGPTKDIPELAALSHWTGTWTAQIEKPKPRVGESRGEWIVGGRYLQVTWHIDADADNPESRGTYLMTYDVKQKLYRQWHFNSDGFTGEATGVWDAATQTMTWTARNAPNRRTISKDRFPKSDRREFAMTITDLNGKTLFEMSGHHNRRMD